MNTYNEHFENSNVAPTDSTFQNVLSWMYDWTIDGVHKCLSESHLVHLVWSLL